ncbi:hypothetical protein QYF36_012982 [Acer negundo]|nr:hypothetical protein QYF36_012982 [Acer negundo]
MEQDPPLLPMEEKDARRPIKAPNERRTDVEELDASVDRRNRNKGKSKIGEDKDGEGQAASTYSFTKSSNPEHLNRTNRRRSSSLSHSGHKRKKRRSDKSCSQKASLEKTFLRRDSLRKS